MSSPDRIFSDYAWPWIQAAEGIDSDAPSDKGGRTRYGISQAAHPDVDVPRLTLAQARAIFYRDYWLGADCDRLPPALAVAVFGGAVQHDPKDSVRFLQRALGVRVNGDLGPVTAAAAQRAAQAELLCQYLALRALHHQQLAIDDPSQQG